MPSDTINTLRGGLIGFGVGVFSGYLVSRAPSSRDQRGANASKEPCVKECGHGRWYSVPSDGVVHHYVDEPFILFVLEWSGGSRTSPDKDPNRKLNNTDPDVVINATFRGHGTFIFKFFTSDKLLPRQIGQLYRLTGWSSEGKKDWYTPIIAAREFFERLTRAGLISEGGSFSEWPEKDVVSNGV